MCIRDRLLGQYGFTLHKWASNEPNVVTEHSNLSLPLNKQGNVRTLGILWNNSTDSFLFDIKSFPVESSISKRRILSIIAGIYDPLGLIGPIVFLYKQFMQQLWLCNLGWDEPISEQLYLYWHSLCDKLYLIGKIIVPRSIPVSYTHLDVYKRQYMGFVSYNYSKLKHVLLHPWAKTGRLKKGYFA